MPQKNAMRTPLPISPILSLPSQLLHVLSKAFSTPQLPTVLLHRHSTVVSKTPGLKTRKQKPGGGEVAVQLVWTVCKQDTASFFMLQPEALPRPYALFTRSGKRKVISQLQAGKLSLSISVPSSVFKVYAKLNLKIDSHHGKKPNNALKCQMPCTHVL